MIRSILRLFSVPDKLALFGLMRSMNGQVQLVTASALLRSGVMQHLSVPRTLGELSTLTGIEDHVTLSCLLDLAAKRRLLRFRNGCYSARSRLARSLARTPEGPVASMLQEVATYHHKVFDDLPGFLRGQPQGTYLDDYGELVAQSSRIMAPWICGFTADAIGREKGRNILELGCGSGAYLSFYAELHKEHHGVGIDFDQGVLDAAQNLLGNSGFQDRFSVQQADMREGQQWPDGLFEVITAHQNVYYFNAEERAALWRTCHEHLTDHGQLIIVTSTSGGPLSDYFSLILLSTAGCHLLPSVEEIGEELKAAGFEVMRQERLIPGDSVWGVAARKVP